MFQFAEFLMILGDTSTDVAVNENRKQYSYDSSKMEFPRQRRLHW